MEVGIGGGATFSLYRNGFLPFVAKIGCQALFSPATFGPASGTASPHPRATRRGYPSGALLLLWGDLPPGHTLTGAPRLKN